MDHLYTIANKKNKDVGIWETASHYYYSVDEINETIKPTIVNLN